MVSADVRRSATGVTSTLDNRDLKGAAFAAVFGAGGIMLGQRTADRVAGMAGFNKNPSSLTDYAGHVGAKGLGAALTGAVSMNASNNDVQAAGGWLAAGMLASAGVDIVEVSMDQLGGLTGGSSGSMLSSSASSSKTPRVKRASGPSRRSSSSTSGSKAAAGGIR